MPHLSLSLFPLSSCLILCLCLFCAHVAHKSDLQIYFLSLLFFFDFGCAFCLGVAYLVGLHAKPHSGFKSIRIRCIRIYVY